MSPACAVPGARHSDDVVTVLHGRPEPTILCGFHASPLLIAASLQAVRS